MRSLEVKLIGFTTTIQIYLMQIVGVLISSVYAFAFTFGMLWLINKITKVKTSEAEEGELDAALHG
ncbi:hypothetical protein KKC97_00160, partial [bacterium]|nr:hypothetical protein [bacterium]MBU1636063.1 hypothetical protein [bacterium]MBU1920333.1 hypothetical protein [bacterium]